MILNPQGNSNVLLLILSSDLSIGTMRKSDKID